MNKVPYTMGEYKKRNTNKPIYFSKNDILTLQVILSSLVYEKQQKLRAMMKMDGLGDMAYWTISYCYFLLISSLYIFLLVTFGAIVGKMIYTTHSFMRRAPYSTINKISMTFKVLWLHKIEKRLH